MKVEVLGRQASVLFSTVIYIPLAGYNISFSSEILNFNLFVLIFIESRDLSDIYLYVF